jgi:hypothetical protein
MQGVLRPDLDPADPLLGEDLDDAYVAIDVETTGTDRECDDIVQLAAVRFRGGRPVAGLNRYVRPETAELTEAHRLKMGWPVVPDALLIGKAQALAELAAFTGTDVAMAWNARFDAAFLARAGWLPPRLVDGIALAALVDPVSPLSLPDRVAGVLGGRPAWPENTPVEGTAPVSFDAHHALYDTLAAGLVHAATLSALRRGVGPDVAAALWLGLGAQPAPAPALNLPDPPAASGPGGPPAPPAAHGRRRAVWLTGTDPSRLAIATAISRSAAQRTLAVVPSPAWAAEEAGRAGQRAATLYDPATYLCRQHLATVDPDALDRTGRYVLALTRRLAQVLPAAAGPDLPRWLHRNVPGAPVHARAFFTGCAHAGCSGAVAADQAAGRQLIFTDFEGWLAGVAATIGPAAIVVAHPHVLAHKLIDAGRRPTRWRPWPPRLAAARLVRPQAAGAALTIVGRPRPRWRALI